MINNWEQYQFNTMLHKATHNGKRSMLGLVGKYNLRRVSGNGVILLSHKEISYNMMYDERGKATLYAMAVKLLSDTKVSKLALKDLINGYINHQSVEIQKDKGYFPLIYDKGGNILRYYDYNSGELIQSDLPYITTSLEPIINELKLWGIQHDLADRCKIMSWENEAGKYYQLNIFKDRLVLVTSVAMTICYFQNPYTDLYLLYFAHAVKRIGARAIEVFKDVL